MWKQCIVGAVFAFVAACVLLIACSQRPGAVSGGDDAGEEDAGSQGFSCPPLDNDKPDVCPGWNEDVHAIIATYCLRCHLDGGIAGPKYDFSTYAQVHALSSTMLTQVNFCSMPPWDASPPADQPPPDVRQTLLSWLTCGAPDN
ncbi:MAG TPA: hypothetical protein VIY73_24810 [Polyangiaceae bacterium]